MSDLQEIYVLNKRLKLLHSAKGFKTSMDSILLAASCPATAGDHILDMGCGVGGAGLCVLSRIEGVTLTGVEIQSDHAELARQNAVANMMQDRAEFVVSDIRDLKKESCGKNPRSAPARLSGNQDMRSAPARLSNLKYDHVICNPPYLEAGAHLRSPSEEKATAMGHEDTDLTVKDWIDVAYFCLKSNGSLSMVHRADKVDKIIQALGKRFGAVEIVPLWPKERENAKRVIVRCIKDRRSPAILHAGLVLHKAEGGYTAQAEKILRGAEALL